MGKITSIQEYLSKQADEFEALEDELSTSMAQSVAVDFVDRMSGHYPQLDTSLIVYAILGGLLGRLSTEADKGSEGAKGVIAWAHSITGSVLHDLDIDVTEEAMDSYLDHIFRHREGDSRATKH